MDDIERLWALVAQQQETITRLMAVLERDINPGNVPAAPEEAAPDWLTLLTAKQHAALQGLLLGMSNREIGAALGVSQQMAKIHGRAIIIGTRQPNRKAVIGLLRPWFDAVDAEEYQAVVGIPKDVMQSGRVREFPVLLPRSDHQSGDEPWRSR